MKRLVQSMVEAFFKSFAIMLLIACVASFVLALISTLMVLSGEMTWKAPAIFAVIGVFSGTVCFVVSDIVM